MDKALAPQKSVVTLPKLQTRHFVGKFHHCECIGINCVLAGWARPGLNDRELLAKGIECRGAIPANLINLPTGIADWTATPKPHRSPSQKDGRC
jgi:hypothetical protein